MCPNFKILKFTSDFFLLREDCVTEEDLIIPYPTLEPDECDFWSIVKDNDLEESCLPEQIEQLEELLEKIGFSNDPSNTDMIDHVVELTSDRPIRLKLYRSSPHQTEILK